jgi:glycosyltransferase involved in cell wall biosynthesis
MIYADQRWIGDNGIGRFSRRVLAGLDYQPLTLASPQVAPMDPWRLMRELRTLTRNDLFFSPGYNSPLFCDAPFIFTIHDLNHIDRPENSSALKRIYYSLILKRACHRASHVLTVSEFSRSRILEWSGVPPEKVVNVRCGVDPEYHPLVAPYGLPFPYLLCVGNRKLHKNEIRTIEAFSRATNSRDIWLVFTGNPTPELLGCIERNRVSSRVLFMGLVPDERLPALYRGAEALIFASLYEGFGLPALEAMACGTPTVSSNTSALPELVGDAAILVDPTSMEQIADAIDRVLSDSDLRRLLRERGIAQAAQFSWESTTAMVRQIVTADADRAVREEYGSKLLSL